MIKGGEVGVGVVGSWTDPGVAGEAVVIGLIEVVIGGKGLGVGMMTLAEVSALGGSFIPYMSDLQVTHNEFISQNSLG